jgi:hypothetical protein
MWRSINNRNSDNEERFDFTKTAANKVVHVNPFSSFLFRKWNYVYLYHKYLFRLLE